MQIEDNQTFILGCEAGSLKVLGGGVGTKVEFLVILWQKFGITDLYKTHTTDSKCVAIKYKNKIRMNVVLSMEKVTSCKVFNNHLGF